MRASHTLVALATALPLSLVAGAASAHIDLVSPPPRLTGSTSNNQLKTKPCGQTTNKRTTDKVTTYTPGQKVDVKIKEYVNHPGYFAVAFDPDGDDSFPFPIANADKVNMSTDDPKTTFPLSDKVLGLRTDKDKECYTENASTHECSISITIPNMNCQNCTLQVIQFMYDKLGDNNDNEYYYQCADIKIEGAVGGSGSGGAAGSGAGGSSAGGTGGAAGSSSGGTGGTAAGETGSGTAGTLTGSSGSATSAGAPATAGTSATAGTATTPAGGTATTPPTGGAPADDGGCGIARHAPGGASVVAALGLLFALGRRRRSR